MKLSTHLVRRWFAAAALLLTGALFTAPATAAPTASLDATCQDPGAREQLAQLRRQIAELRAAQAELRRELERLRGAHGQEQGEHGEHGEHGEQEKGEHAEHGEVEQRASPRRAQGFALGQPGARGFTMQGGMRGMRAGPGQFTVQGNPARGRWISGRPLGRVPGVAMRGFAMPRMQVLHGPGHVTWQVRGEEREGNSFAWRADAPHARQDAQPQKKAQPKKKAKPQQKAKPKTQGKPGEKRIADDKPDNQSIFRSLQLAPAKMTVRVETEESKGDAQGHRVFRVLKDEVGEKAGEHEVRVEVRPEIRIHRDAKDGGEGETVEVKDLELKVEKAKKAPKKAAPQKKISVSV